MIKIYFPVLLLSFVSCCNYFSMEPSLKEFKLVNNSDQKLAIYANIWDGNEIDSTFHNAGYEKCVGSYDYCWLVTDMHIKYDNSMIGISIFLFTKDYFDSKWNREDTYPDTYLDESKALRVYHYNRAQLDSLDWTIIYP